VGACVAGYGLYRNTHKGAENDEESKKRKMRVLGLEPKTYGLKKAVAAKL